MTTVLRRTDSDDPAFRALVRELDAELVQLYGEAQAAYTELDAVDRDAAVVVAYHDGLPSGCGCVRPHHDLTAELKRMYVAPAVRNRGVARRIIAELEAWCRELGFTDLILETGVRQPEAMKLYASSGFSRTPAYPPYDTMPLSLCMAKRL